MATVTMIPARKTVGARKKTEDAPKLRVAAYCRVSTETDEQATSYEAQIEHYTEFIGNHPGWELAGIYADDGISGTNTKKRDEFNRMIDECHAGNIDMIITKSISRFARNTLDCLKFIRELKEINIPVFFEKEIVLFTFIAGIRCYIRIFDSMITQVFHERDKGKLVTSFRSDTDTGYVLSFHTKLNVISGFQLRISHVIFLHMHKCRIRICL